MVPTAPLSQQIDLGTRRAGRWEWGLCWLMFACTVLNYMDRQAMSLVASKIKEEFHIGNEDFGWVLAAFQLSYALWQLPAGYFADRWNVRWLYAGAVIWWSLAGIAAAFSPTLSVLIVCRILLGFGESFNWPCALRVTGMILPPADRGLGNGIFNSGAAVGAVLTPLLVPPLAERYGWRTAFVVVGCLGFAWVAAWLGFLRGDKADQFAGRSTSKPLPPAADEFESPRTGLSGLARGTFGGVVLLSALISLLARWYGPNAIWCGITTLMVGMLLAGLALPLSSLKGVDWAESLGEVVRHRRFWILVVVSITVNVCWHFLVNWLPTYLKEDRGMTFLASGMISSLPFLAADLGNLGGGAASRFLARTGLTAAKARTRVMIGCALLISCGAWVGQVRSDTITIVLLGIMALGTAAFMANYFAFIQEVSSRHTGLIAGILGGLGNLFVAGFLPFAGKVKDVTGEFGPIFILVGVLPFIGLAALMFGWGSEGAEGDPA